MMLIPYILYPYTYTVTPQLTDELRTNSVVSTNLMASSFVTIDVLYRQNDELALNLLPQIMVKKMDEQTSVSRVQSLISKIIPFWMDGETNNHNILSFSSEVRIYCCVVVINVTSYPGNLGSLLRSGQHCNLCLNHSSQHEGIYSWVFASHTHQRWKDSNCLIIPRDCHQTRQ